jgi:hypothetical protein
LLGAVTNQRLLKNTIHWVSVCYSDL